MLDIPQEYITKIYRMFDLTPMVFDKSKIDDFEGWDGKRQSKYIWIVSIKPSDNEPRFYLSGAKLSNLTFEDEATIEFVVLVPEAINIHKEYRFGSFTMDDDPTYTALLETPIFLRPSQSVSLDMPQFTIYVLNSFGITRWSYMGLGEYEDISKLWQSFFEIIDKLQSQSSEMKDFFEQHGRHTRIINPHYKNE